MAGPEKSFENKIKAYIKGKGGWQVKFFANSMTKKGVPDILACINGKFFGIEVKAQNGKPSELQLAQCRKIREAGGIAIVVYPSAWDQLKNLIDNPEQIECADIPTILK